MESFKEVSSVQLQHLRVCSLLGSGGKLDRIAPHLGVIERDAIPATGIEELVPEILAQRSNELLQRVSRVSIVRLGPEKSEQRIP